MAKAGKTWQDSLFDEKVIMRFVSKLEQRDNGCIEWIGNTDRYGYGRLSIGTVPEQKMVGSHRWALQFAMGGVILPPEIQACHSCDNPACVSPSHLFPGTNLDNSHDRMEKFRQAVMPTSSKEDVLNFLKTFVNNDKITKEEIFGMLEDC